MRLLIVAFVAWLTALPVFAAVDIEEVKTDAGFTAWLVEDHSIPFTALSIRFRGGTSLDAHGKRGATYLMTGLLEEGAGDLDARQFAREAETLAARFGFDASDDEISVSAQFLTENRDEAVALLKTAITKPRFDEDALERVRRQVLSGLRSDAQDPDDIARQTFRNLVYGDHPYGSDGKGTIESVSALTRQDLVDAHQRSMTRDRVYIGAVGDISTGELSALIDELLADLPETGAPLPEMVEITLDGGLTVVDFDTPQSVALFGHAGIERDHPDFFPAYVMNHILGGGGFESRLMREVREKRGLTYGIYSYLLPKDHAAVYLGSVASANAVMAETISVVRAEWQKMATEGVTEEELEAAKKYLTGAYPLRFDGNSQIANIMVGMQMQGLPIDYINTRNDMVNAVTLEDIRRVASELLQPDQLHFVVVGKPVGLDG